MTIDPGSPTLVDFQFELAGVIFGTDAEMDVETFSPGGYTIRSQDVPISHRDGMMMGRDYLTPGVWAWDMFTNRLDYTEALETAAELAEKWRSPNRRTVPGAVYPLRYRLAGRTRRVYGRPRRWQQTIDPTFLTGRLLVGADFALVDDLTYADVEEFVEVDLVAGSAGGLAEPLVDPLVATGASAPTEVILDVVTDVDTWAVVTFTGPITNPYVEVNGWRLQIDGTLSGGDSLVVDPRPWVSSAILNGNVAAGHLLDKGARLDEMLLSYGEHELVWGGLDESASSAVRLSWRPAMVGL